MSTIDNLLTMDPLAEAEKVTGESYKDNEETQALGMLLHMEKAAAVREEMGLRDDTFYSSEFGHALRVLMDLGFQIIHQHDFFPRSRSNKGSRIEQFVVMWRDGVLITATSYMGTTVNSLNAYYNWEPHEGVNPFTFTASGHLHGDSYDAGRKVWIGHQDFRQGLRHYLARLEDNGRFLSTWVERPSLWLLDYDQEQDNDADYKTINEQVIATFPAEVIKAMGSADGFSFPA